MLCTRSGPRLQRPAEDLPAKSKIIDEKPEGGLNVQCINFFWTGTP